MACVAGLGLLAFTAARMPAARVAASPTRAALLRALATGRCFSSTELARAAGVSRKTAEYHVHVLERAGLAARCSAPGRALYAGAASVRTAGLAARALEHPVRRAMLQLAEAHPGASVADLARQLGIKSSTAHFHARVLSQHGLLAVGPAGVAVLREAHA